MMELEEIQEEIKVSLEVDEMEELGEWLEAQIEAIHQGENE